MNKLYQALRYGTIKHYTSRGVTSVHELVYSAQGIRAWQQLKDEGNLPLRLRLYLTHPYFNYNEFRKTGLRSGFGDEWLSLGGFKLFTQGDGCDGNLIPAIDSKYTQEELDKLVYDMHSDGQHIWMHTVTKEGYNQGLLTYKRALDKLPKHDHRLRGNKDGYHYGCLGWFRRKN